MIGVFDSGLGGLTALSELVSLLPEEDFIYLADSAHLPYGKRSRSEIARLSASAVSFLRDKGANEVLFACGTASSLGLDFCKQYFPFRLYEVVTPSLLKAISLTKSRRVGVAATEATVKSGSFRRLMDLYAPDCILTEVCCPSLVSLSESGTVHDETCYSAVADALTPLVHAKIDTLILGCTHFALLNTAIRALLPSVSIVESGKEGARALAAERHGATRTAARSGRIRLYATANETALAKAASTLLGKRLRAEKINPDII